MAMDDRRPSRLGLAAITVAALVLPVVAALAVAAIVAPLGIPAWVKATLGLVVLVGGFIVGGRASVRATQRRYPPVVFSGFDHGPALRVMTDTAARLGSRNHVVFGIAPSGGPTEGELQALISIKTDRHGDVSEQVVQVPYAGRHEDPAMSFPQEGVALAGGWEIRHWAAGDYVVLAASPTMGPRDLLELAVDATVRLHAVDPAEAWELTFVV